jgi:hypothetical protein
MFSQAATTRDLGLTERGRRKVIKTRPNSKPTTVERIREIAALYRTRFGEWAEMSLGCGIADDFLDGDGFRNVV